MWHKKWSQKLKKYLKVVEHLEGKAMWEKTQLQTESLRSYVRLCQVGIQHGHKVQLEELCPKFRQKK